MKISLHSDFEFHDITVRYVTDDDGRAGLMMFPTAMKDQLAMRRGSLKGERFIDVLPGNESWPARALDPLVQVKILGDSDPGGFAAGHTMRNSPSVDGFKLSRQSHERGTIATTLLDGRGHRIEHRLAWSEGDAGFRIETEFFNDSGKPVTLEMLASFSLGGITPFAPDDAPDRLRVHRFRSGWAAEGRLETRSVEDLHLERSWSGAGAFSERFGQTGTMPVRKWFPFAAVEDSRAGVVWGAQLAWAGSWQMEIHRQHDEISISGGLADRESGHWMKTLAPGESIVSPSATISCARGGLDELCDRLTAMQDMAVNKQPAVERDLPVIFNEFCTTWGDPSHDNLTRIADRIQGSGIRYLVIDAGWYRSPETSVWDGSHGDWVPGDVLFPNGLEATAEAIRKRGLIPGIWFEMETVGEKSTAFSFVDHMLKRDGYPVTVRGRRFWDLNDPWVIDHLTEKVIVLLESCGFGYLKVDYNETLGLGCDHPDSLGEGLRNQVLASYRFFERIRERLPDLVIENCASGGHRHEPSMLGRTAMSSFSDAHELVEIPIIAANLHRLMLPRQNQIWAVLHPTDSLQRIRYSLAATFLGRMCLSGGVENLSAESWNLSREAIALYQKAAPVIKYGVSRRFGDVGASWRHPKGWQAVVRTSDKQALVVVHAFAESPADLEVPLNGNWKLQEAFSEFSAEVANGMLKLAKVAAFSGSVFLLERP